MSMDEFDMFWPISEEQMNDRERAEQERMELIEGYCDYCEETGHTFRSCPARDDESLYEP